jgi:hypothetical protein
MASGKQTFRIHGQWAFVIVKNVSTCRPPFKVPLTMKFFRDDFDCVPINVRFHLANPFRSADRCRRSSDNHVEEAIQPDADSIIKVSHSA